MIKLKEYNLKMGLKEYEMFQEIPAKENGSTNLCFGIPIENFRSFIENQISRQFQKISTFDTPVKMYIVYDKTYPIGYVGIRTKINKQWKEWSGNIFYTIRPAMRNKGYGTKALNLALRICKKSNMKVVYIQSSEGNIYSQKVIENNGGILYKEDGTKYYKIKI